MKNKRIFISGGAGVIGQELVKKLVEQGAIVMVGDLMPIPKDFPKSVIYRRGDLNFITQKELNSFNPELFFHLAATFERTLETYEQWEANFWHNIRLSNHLMTLMRNIPTLQRVVYASSYLIYNEALYNFDKPKEQPVKLKETDPISPRNLVGMAKLAHEIELKFLANFKSDKFTSICARIFRGYGKNSRDIISRWIRDLLENKKIQIYSPEGWFDYIYAEDTAEGLIRLANVKDSGIVNLGTGRSCQVADVVRVLRTHFPKMQAEYIHRKQKIEASEADVNKLKSILNWIPKRCIEETIPEIIEFERNKSKNDISQKNILITSISKKIPLIKAVIEGVRKISSSIKVYGGDIDCNCLGQYFVDSFWKMPKLNQDNIDELLKFCIDNNIGLIIPTRDGELLFFAKIKERLKVNGIDIMISDVKSIENSIDKLSFSIIKNINAIPSTTNINDLETDTYVVKERYGAGSKSIGINLNKTDALLHAMNLDNPLFQPFVKGNEISVDAYVTKSGKIKGVVMRKRDFVISGESQITTTFYDKILEATFESIIATLNLQGHIILQAIIDEKSEIHLIECNARFGGASTLSLQAGLDSFYWAYIESQGISIDQDYPFIKPDKTITQIRHPQDIYI